MNRPHASVQVSLWALAAVLVVCWSTPAAAELRLRSLCRVKGQQPIQLQGLGLVVGLKGTGDSASPATMQRLAAVLSQLGNPLLVDGANNQLEDQLRNTKNVALVWVTATLPPSGAQFGSTFSCTVAALEAKSLEGGVLAGAALRQQNDGQSPAELQNIVARANGLLTIPDPSVPTVATINDGCRMEASVENPFVVDGVIRLVLNPVHASFKLAQDIEDLINRQPDFATAGQSMVATARDATTIEVAIPETYRENPVLFTSMVLDLRLISAMSEARVVLDERTGTVVVSSEVEIGPVVVTHENLTIDVGDRVVSQFVAVDSKGDSSLTPVKSLLEALNALKVPSQDVINIIRKINDSGHLYGTVIER